VFSAPTELAFFNSRERFETLGVAGYRALFEGWAGEPIVGEATPGYMFWRHHPDVMAERIEHVVPDVRLLAILRNPVDRAQSAHVHHIEQKKLPPDSRLVELIREVPPETDPLGIVVGGWYAASLEPFRQRFGDRLLTLLHDDALDDPRGVYDRALRHIGSAPDFVPPELDRIRFSYQEGPESASERYELSLEERVEVYEYFRQDILKLEQMLGRDLSVWDP
jgi:hypothetical protein